MLATTSALALAAALTVISPESAAAQTNWTGVNSPDFTDPGNWTGGVPTIGVAADISTTLSDETVLGFSGAASGGTGLFSLGSTAAGNLTIQRGSTLTSSGTVTIGENPGSTGIATVRGPGSTWTMSDPDGSFVGASGEGTLVVQNGGMVTVAGDLTVALEAGSKGKIDITSGGTLETGALVRGSGSGGAQVNFDGGTLRTNRAGNFVTGFSGNELNIGPGGLTIDDNGFVDIVADSPFTGQGGLTKTGLGTLTLTADNTYAGRTTIAAGELVLGANGTTGSIVGNVTNNGQLTFNRADAYTFEGVISGSGSVGQSGDGVTVLTADNTYTGGTEIARGTLQLGDGGTSGSVVGPILNEGVLVFNRSNTLTIPGVISGPGSVTQAGTGTTVLTADNTYTGNTMVNAGTLLVNGSITSPTTVNAGGTLGGIGAVGPIMVQSGGTVAPGNSGIGPLTAVGNVTFQSGSIYQADINPQGQSDLLLATGTATLNGGNVAVFAAGGIYTPGTRYTILTADGGVTGRFERLTDTLPLLDLTASYDPNNVYLDVARNGVPFHHLAVTPNQRNTAQVTERLGPGHPVHDAVVSVPDEAAARQAFHALSGEVHASLPGVFVNDSRYVRNAVLGRLRQAPYAGGAGPLAALGIGGPALAYQRSPQEAYGADLPVKAPPPGALPPPASDLTFWAQGFGAWGSFDGDGNAASVKRSLGGALVGLDGDLAGNGVADRWRVGFAAGYSQSDVNIGDRASRATVDSGHVALYGGGTFGAWNLRGGAAYAHHEIDTHRWIMFPGLVDRATADYSGGTGQVFGELGYGFNLGRLAVEPFAGLAWVHVKTNSFTEGDGVAALRSSTVTEEAGYSTLGARFATTFTLANGMALTPRASFAWQHAFNDVTPEAALAFLQSPGVGFGIAGVPLARDSALVEAGLDLNVMPQMTLGVSYLGQLASSTEDHAVKGQFTWRF